MIIFLWKEWSVFDVGQELSADASIVIRRAKTMCLNYIHLHTYNEQSDDHAYSKAIASVAISLIVNGGSFLRWEAFS